MVKKIAFSYTASVGNFHIFFVGQTGILTEIKMNDPQLKGGNIYPRFSPFGYNWHSFTFPNARFFQTTYSGKWAGLF
jgi:hypothetical protein